MYIQKYTYIYKNKLKIDFSLFLILLVLIQIFLHGYSFYYVVGSSLSLLIFAMHEIVTLRIFALDKVNIKFSVLIFYFLKITIIVYIGILFLLKNPYSVFAYVAGLYVNILSLVIYYCIHKK